MIMPMMLTMTMLAAILAEDAEKRAEWDWLKIDWFMQLQKSDL